MEQREMALVPVGFAETTTLNPSFEGGQGAHRIGGARDGRPVPYGEDGGAEQDEGHLRMLEERTKNRLLCEELKGARAFVRSLIRRREQERRVCQAAMRVLCWILIAVLFTAITVASVMAAPPWTGISPCNLDGDGVAESG